MSFSGEDDVNHMRKHEGYEEIKDETNANAYEAVQIPQAAEAEVLKKRGRPRKEVVTEI